jgi:hypothetical protein
MVLLDNPFPWYISTYALLQACVKWRFFIIFSGINEWKLHVSFCACCLFHHQRQIEMVGSVSNAADKVLQEAHKFYRLRTQQGPVAASTLKQSCIVHHIWWLLESFSLQPISSWYFLHQILCIVCPRTQ